MTTVDPRKHKCCAFCKRWEGDANLTNQGAGKGMIRFNTSKRGNCILLRNTRAAHEGVQCKDFAISPEADRFVL